MTKSEGGAHQIELTGARLSARHDGTTEVSVTVLVHGIIGPGTTLAASVDPGTGGPGPKGDGLGK
ncbi:MAG: hypothetical protein MI919_05175 [Holophagales bacterium]|nr:hypothetical protein [Holophagales bacterium]